MAIDSEQKVFIDTAPFIYLLEEHPTFASQVELFFAQHEYALWYTSVLTFNEFAIKPYELQKLHLLEDFKALLDEIPVLVEEIDWDVADLAARMRSQYPSLRAFDALQIASALTLDCDVFFTNDKSLKRISELSVILVEEVG